VYNMGRKHYPTPVQVVGLIPTSYTCSTLLLTILSMELANVRKYTALNLPNDPLELGPSRAVSDGY
jgi:hypothetical protein